MVAGARCWRTGPCSASSSCRSSSSPSGTRRWRRVSRHTPRKLAGCPRTDSAGRMPPTLGLSSSANSSPCGSSAVAAAVDSSRQQPPCGHSRGWSSRSADGSIRPRRSCVRSSDWACLEHLRGRYNSFQSMVWTVAGVIGPASAGLLLGNQQAGWWVVAVVGGTALAALMFLELHRHLTPDQDGRADIASGVAAH